jgi:hypothetical protein
MNYGVAPSAGEGRKSKLNGGKEKVPGSQELFQSYPRKTIATVTPK